MTDQADYSILRMHAKKRACTSRSWSTRNNNGRSVSSKLTT